MSAFLGKIHYWLYDKIKLHEKLIEDICELAKNNNYKVDGLIKESYLRYGLPITGPLENEIEHTNIHGWLQERIISVETRLAYIITELLKNKVITEEDINNIFYKNGVDTINQIGITEVSLEEFFNLIFDYMIEGMPCDRVNEIIKNDEYSLEWKTIKDLHKPYWDVVAGDVSKFHKFRDSWINGFLSKNRTPYKYTREDNGINKISKDEISDEVFDGIDLMMKEHKLISRMLKVIRKACIEIMNGSEINYTDFENMIDFVRNYADKHHHGKEEELLFNKMIDEIGGPAEKLVKFGMLVEHDLGRLYMSDLEEALNRFKSGDNNSKVDVIGNAVSYTHLLTRHIDKEDNIAYQFARRELSKETLNRFNEECREFEKRKQEEGVTEKYIKILEKLENKYL